MFFNITFNADEPKGAFSLLVEVPTEARAETYLRMQREQTGSDVSMHPIYTSDPYIAPEGYTYRNPQIWIDQGADPGWCRVWFKS